MAVQGAPDADVTRAVGEEGWNAATAGADAEAALRTTNKNLNVLRDRFAKLNEEHLRLKQQYDRLQTQIGEAAEPAYINDVISAVQALFNSPRFSDVTLVVDGKRFPAHKFLLKARSKYFREANMDDVDEFTIEGDVASDLFLVLLRFLYTDEIEVLNLNDVVGVNLLDLADLHGLVALRASMESVLISMLKRENCTRLFREANRLKAQELRQAALEIILNEFEAIDLADFEKLDATLMAEIYRARTEHFIHLAVKHGREDVVFLYLLDPEIQKRIDRVNNNGLSPLQVALHKRHESIANTLIERGANPSLANELNRSILMVAVEEGDTYSALYLLKKGASFEMSITDSGMRPLHVAAKSNQAEVVTALLETGADVNAQAYGSSPESDGTTALHLAVRLGHTHIIGMLLKRVGINVNLRDRYNNSCLWHALASASYDTAAALVAKGANVNEQMADASSLLQRTVRQLDERAARFLVENGANVNHTNNAHETALHWGCATTGKDDMLTFLLASGANATLQDAEGQTPMHVALQRGPMSYAKILIKHPGIPLDILDNLGDSLIWLSLERGEHAFASLLVQSGASLSTKTPDGYTHLGRAIVRAAESTEVYEDDKGEQVDYSKNCEAIALFYISAGAPLYNVDLHNQAAITLAILGGCAEIVRALCIADPKSVQALPEHSFNPHAATETVAKIPAVEHAAGTPLSLALIVRAPWPVLDALVKAGANVNWTEPDTGCPLLMRRIVEGDESGTGFLISAGCIVNFKSTVPSSWSQNWEGPIAQGLCTPLHVTAILNQISTVSLLVDANADLDSQDEQGETALHVAMVHRHLGVAQALLAGAERRSLNVNIRNARGQTVFGVAYALRDLGLAQSLASLSNGFSTEIDERTGLTFLQRAIDLNDLEGAQFLMHLKVNALNPGRHPSRDSPMHMAAARGLVPFMELILKVDPSAHEIMNDQGRTPLHLAAINNHLVTVDLLVRQPRCVAQDVQGETALHLAIAAQHLAVAHLLVERAPSMGKRVNTREELPLHVLARTKPPRGMVSADANAKNKGTTGRSPPGMGKIEGMIALLEMLISAAEDIDVRDGEGSTALLKAYFALNDSVAIELMRRGASITAKNHAGASIMDYITNESGNDEMAGRLRLQRSLLDLIDKDMPWQDGPVCELCQVKFNFQKRKHHCRHCGRIGCSNCLPSSRQHAILKFGLTKPERLCAPCYDYIAIPVAQHNTF